MKKVLFSSILLSLLSTVANAETPQVSTCPKVIHTNDGSIDVYTQEYAMALASAGEINLVGIIADEGTGYTSTKKAYVKPKIWEKGRQQCADIVGKARRSGMINIPDPVAGASWALDRPASGIIEDTTPLDTPGSRLIVQQANKATPEKPVYIVTGGALTCVADAYLLDNSITDKVVVVSVFGFASHMGGYNGQIDGWATYIVLQKFKYIQFCVNELSYYPRVPKVRLSGKEIPENELKRLMLDKEQQHVHIPIGKDADVPPIIYLMRPDYVLSTRRVSFSHWKNTKTYGNSYPKIPVFKDDPAGNAIVVTSADKNIATAEWWRAMSNPAAYTGTVLQQSPFNGVASAVPGKIQAEEFDWGGKGVAFNELSIANSPKYTYTTGWPLYRVDASIADLDDDYEGNIEECHDAVGGYNLMGLAPGEWLEYTINAAEAKSYDIILRVASSGTGRLRIKLDGVDKTGAIDIPNTGGPGKWQDVVIESVPLDAGKQVMQIYVEQGGFKFDYLVVGSD